jgi:hypothetical protein
MYKNKSFQQGVLAAMVVSLVACGGGGGGGGGKKSSAPSSVASSSIAASSVDASSTPASSVAPSSVPASSSEATSSSVSSTPQSNSSSSIAAGVTTLFNVSINPPQLDDSAPQTKTGRNAVAQKIAEDDSLALNQLAVVVVDLAGNVVRTIPLDSTNSTQNLDGSWSIRVPGYPQLDCVIIANLNGPITVFDVGDNVFDSDLLLTPTTDENLELSLASTAAYQNFVDSLGGEGTFDDLGLDVSDPTQLTVLNNLIETIQEVLEGQTYIGAGSIAEALVLVQSQVQAIVEVEAANITAPAVTTTLAAAAGAGNIAWFESFEPTEIFYGVLTQIEDEKEYIHNGEGLTLVDDNDEGDLVLLDGAWVVTEDSFRVSALNEDGSITFNESTDLEGATVGQVNGKATQTINLEGRNIANFFNAYGDTRGMVNSLNPSATFADDAIAYRTTLTSVGNEYRLWFNPGNDNGVCPWDSEKNANTYGGNCETANTLSWVVNQEWPITNIAQSGLAQIKSADVELGEVGSVLVPFYWPGNNDVIGVQLVLNNAHVARYYRYSYTTNTAELIATSTWSDITLPGVTNDVAAAAAAIEIPAEVLAEGDFDSEDSYTLFTVNAGYVRIGNKTTAGEVLETGVLLYNAAAAESVLTALDYQPAIAGAWVIGGDYLMFRKDGTFAQVKISNDDIRCQEGFAYGTYSWNPATQAFSVDLEEDNTAVEPDDSCSMKGINSVSIAGNTMTATEGGETFTMDKVTSSESAPLAGAWFVNGDFFTFTGDNTFIHAKIDNDDPNCQPGWATGSFTLEGQTLIGTVAEDHTAVAVDDSCSMEGEFSTLLNGNSLLVTPAGEDSFTLHRFGNPLN